MTANPSPATSSAISTQSLREFHLFSELPVEIRLQIWECAIQPRIIRVDDLSGDHGPAILWTCRDSRAVSRPQYSEYRATRVSDGVKVGFFINPSIDVFEVCNFAKEARNCFQLIVLFNLMACRYPPWLNNAQRLGLAITSEIHANYPNGFLEAIWKQVQQKFPDLRELVLIVDSEWRVELDQLVEILEGPGKLGGMVERFETSLRKYQQEKGLLKSLRLSLMSVGGDETRDMLGKKKSTSSRRSAGLCSTERPRLAIC